MGRVLSPEDLLQTLSAIRGKTPVVTTNGCFDLLHVGHLRYLQACKRPGDALVVLVNSDASIRRLKGPERPIVTEDDRAELLAGLACVDYVTLFGEDTPERLLQAIRPDFHAKGAQYTEETLPEMPLLRSIGAQVRFIPMIENRSTTNLVETIRQRTSIQSASC